MRLPLAVAFALSLACSSASGPTGAGTVAVPTASPDAPWAAWDRSSIDWSRPPTPGPEQPFAPPTPTRLRLANGMRLIALHRPLLPVASVRLVNPAAGSRQDPPGQSGLAAMVSDLLDEGAGDRDALELARALERGGAAVKTSTDVDAGVVEMATLAGNLGANLQLLADVVTRPRFSEADFARIQRDHLSALVEREDDPEAMARVAFLRALYGDRGAGRPPLGWRDSVSRLSTADVRRFYAARWHPADLTLVVVGDADPATVAREAERAFGHWAPAAPAAPAASAPATAPGPEAAPPRLVLVDKKRAAQSYVFIGRPGVTRRGPDFFSAEVLNTALGGAYTSRLNGRLREELGYTYGISSRFEYGPDMSTWRARAAVDTPRTAAAIREAFAIIGRTANEAMSARELDRARSYLIRGWPRRFATNDGIADMLADAAVLALPDDAYATYATGVASVTAGQTLELARALLPTEHLVVAVVGDVDRLRDELTGLGLGPILELSADGTARGSGSLGGASR